MAYYDHPFWGATRPLLGIIFGSGTFTYEDTVLSDKLQEKVLLGVLKLAGLTGPDQQLPSTVRVKHGIHREGRTIHYLLNYSSISQMFDYP